MSNSLAIGPSLHFLSNNSLLKSGGGGGGGGGGVGVGMF